MWLRAVEQETGKIIGKSESSFTVTDNSLMIFAPNGDEEWQSGSTQTIEWEQMGLNSLNILYTYDNGANWTTIASNVPASDLTYEWIIPDTPSTECRIK
ncbi:MAG: hypothetical protein R6V31_10055, partial [Halohasta sp.]